MIFPPGANASAEFAIFETRRASARQKVSDEGHDEFIRRPFSS
jgi:hypothetical protein